MEDFLLSHGGNPDQWLVTCSLDDFEGPELLIHLHLPVAELASNQSFGIKYSVLGIFMGLVESTLANKMAIVRECHV